MKITNEIFQVGGSEFSSEEDAAAYLVSFNGRAVLIDAGCGFAPGRLLDNIRSCGMEFEKVEYLLLTHCHFDHTGGAEHLSGALDCPIAAHELDAVFLEAGDGKATAAEWYGASLKPFAVDQKFNSPRSEIMLGERKIEAIHIPGHSPGSLVYLTESEGLKVLFAQDVHGPLHPALHSNEEDYRKSLELLLSLEADILCEGHYGIMWNKEDTRKFIQSFM